MRGKETWTEERTRATTQRKRKGIKTRSTVESKESLIEKEKPECDSEAVSQEDRKGRRKINANTET